MAKILLIETSGEVCSAAISENGKLLALAEDPQTQQHAALLTLQIQACCRQAQISLEALDAVAVSRGPGAYTALRVGVSVAKGICYALEKPLIAVDTLSALAQASTGQWLPGTLGNCILVPMLDARREEVWLAVYDQNLRELAPAQPLILTNNSFETFISDKTHGIDFDWIVLSGNGMAKTRNGQVSKKTVFSETGKCSAGFLAVLAGQSYQNGDFQDIAYFEPFYMKPPNITVASRPLF